MKTSRTVSIFVHLDSDLDASEDVQLDSVPLAQLGTLATIEGEVDTEFCDRLLSLGPLR